MIKLKSLCIPAFFGLSLFFLISCDDDPNDLGINLLPDSDNFVLNIDSALSFHGSTDTTRTVLTYPLYRKNSFGQYITDSYGYTVYVPDSFNIIGNYTDPIFGHTESALLFKIDTVPTKGLVSDTAKKHFDRLEFKFFIKRQFEEDGQRMEYKLYTTNKALDDTITYSSIKYEDYIDNTPLITIPNIFISQSDYYDSLVFRITDSSFLNKIYKYALTDSSEIIDSPGFCITATPSSGDGGAYLLNILKSQINIHYYYHVKGVISDSLVNNSIIIPIAYHATSFKHDRSGTLLEGIINTPKELQQYIAVLGGKGTFGQLSFDTAYINNWIESWSDSFNVAINKVELTLTPEDFSGQGITSDQYPKQLMMFARVMNDTTMYFLDDHYIGDTYYGGKLSENNQYKFNITKFFAEYIKGRRKKAVFEIKELHPEISFSRVLFKNNYKLRIIYSKIKKE